MAYIAKLLNYLTFDATNKRINILFMTLQGHLIIYSIKTIKLRENLFYQPFCFHFPKKLLITWCSFISSETYRFCHSKPMKRTQESIILRREVVMVPICYISKCCIHFPTVGVLLRNVGSFSFSKDFLSHNKACKKHQGIIHLIN